MPIVVEEEKSKRARFVTAVSILAVLGLVGYTAYALFFKFQAPTPYKPSGTFQQISELSKISIDPVTLLNDPVFKQLSNYITPSLPSATGRTNPFIAYDGYVDIRRIERATTTPIAL